MSPRRGGTTLAIATVAALGLCAAISPAAGAQLVRSVGLSSDGKFVVRGDGTENDIRISRVDTTYKAVDNNHNWEHVGTDCTGEGTHTVTCKAKTTFQALLLEAGGDKDTVTIDISFAPPGSCCRGFATGGDGRDTLKTGATGVRLVGGDGDDTLEGHDGPDELEGNDGDDTLRGLGGSDVLTGGNGTDSILGGEGANDVASYAGHSGGVVVRLDDLPNDGNNDDQKLGGARDNAVGIEDVVGTSAGDALEGSSADNVLRGSGGADVLDGKGGNDLASFSDHTGAVTATVAPGSNNGNSVDGPAGQRDSFTSIEGVRGGAGDDKLVGTAFGADRLEGEGGNDLLDPGDTDVLTNDTLIGGGNNDTVTYAATSLPVVLDFDDVADDGPDANGDGVPEAADTITSTVENAVGGQAGDRLTGGTGPQRLSGGPGNDVLTGGEGDDTLTGGPGADVHDAGSGVDTVSYGDHTDPVTVDLDGVADDGAPGEGDSAGGGGMENIIGGSGDDVLTGNAAANKIVGGRGKDRLLGLTGDDRLQSAEDPFVLFGNVVSIPVVDTEVDCDGGLDTAVRDLADVDAGLGTACEAFEDAPVGEHPTVRISKRARYVARRRLLRFELRCPRRHKQRVCRGRLTARVGAGGPRLSRRYRIRRRRDKTIAFRLSRSQARGLRRSGRVRLVATGRDQRRRVKRTTVPYRLRHVRRGKRVKRPTIVIERRRR